MKGAFLRALGDFALVRGHLVLRALGATWRMRYVGRESVERARFGGGPVLYACSHGLLLPLAFAQRDRGIVVMVSESRDGEIIASVLDRLGFGSVRGSSTRGGVRAALELARLGRQGRDLAITPDGPKGPRGKVDPGIAIVAARANVPIVPMGMAADRAWRARTWDRFLVPLPGSRVVVTYGEPIRVAENLFGRDAKPSELVETLHRVEQGLARAEEVADELLHRGLDGVKASRSPA